MRATASLLIGVTLLLSTPRIAPAQDYGPSQAGKSVSAGVLLGLAGFALPLGIAASGADEAVLLACLVGPFPGLAYAGDTERGLKGMGLRAAIMGAVVVIGMSAAPDPIFNERDGETLGAILTVGAAGTLLSWGADLAAIPGAVRRHNALRVSPMVAPEGRVGVRLDLRW